LPDHFTKVFFSDNGSTTVEVAIKMAIQYWHNKGSRNKTTVIAFENAYHGDTFGAMSAGARNAFNAAFQPLLFNVIHLPVPAADNIDALKKQLSQLAADDSSCGFYFEPLVQGAGGMLMHEAAYLDELLTAAKQLNIICIAMK
jgi:adenosylmethionine-8-amino-7-oxononanoate aminotransferase